MAKNGEGEGRTSVPDVSLFLMFSKGLHCCCCCFLAVPVVAQSDTILFFFFYVFVAFLLRYFLSVCACRFSAAVRVVFFLQTGDAERTRRRRRRRRRRSYAAPLLPPG